MTNDELFTFCTPEYDEDFKVFADRLAETTARVKQNPSLADPPGRNDLLFMTASPWASFTSYSHPRLDPLRPELRSGHLPLRGKFWEMERN